MRIFVSYSRVDKVFCKRLVELLSSHEVWFDHRIEGGQKWWNTILQRLEWCDGLIYLLSSDSVKSEYCLKEYQIALESEKQIFPLKIRERTEIPSQLGSILSYQHLDFTNDIIVESLASLFNALTVGERVIRNSRKTQKLALSPADTQSPLVEDITKTKKLLPAFQNIRFNYTFYLREKQYSDSTCEAYMRWISQYLIDIGGHDLIPSRKREEVLSSLPLDLLKDVLVPAQLNAWYGMLIAKGKDRNTVSLARAGIMSLVTLLEENKLLDGDLMFKLQSVQPPGLVKRGSRVLLDEAQLKKVIFSEPAFSTNDHAFYRDRMVVLLLCLLKISELATTKWNHIFERDHQFYIYVPSRNEEILLPSIFADAINEWKKCVIDSEVSHDISQTHLVRWIRRGGWIMQSGVGVGTFSDIVTRLVVSIDFHDVNVTPDVLRISFQKVVEKSQQSSFSIDELFSK